MSKAGYVLVDAGILPEVYRKVLTAKKYLATGKAASVKEAAQLARQLMQDAKVERVALIMMDAKGKVARTAAP